MTCRATDSSGSRPSLFIRDYRSSDANQIISIYLDSVESLRESRGGRHPDASIDYIRSMPRPALLERMLSGTRIIVSGIAGAGELAGMGAFTINPTAKIINSTMSTDVYVRESYQRGRKGVSVGRAIREEMLSRGRAMGFRKMYGFSTPEAKGFHEKFGAVFRPEHNVRYLRGSVVGHYYEIELNKSPLNRIPFEPLSYRASAFFFGAVGGLMETLGHKRHPDLR